jgi:hypothetical protein
MGFDLHGHRPSTEDGVYFQNNVWWWRPLATYACGIAPGITAHCTHWFSNAGDGLDAENASALAERLEAEVNEGRCERYARICRSQQEMAPNESCWLCDGTGTRKPVPERGAGDVITGIKCNNCHGEGTSRPWRTLYPFSVNNVKNFIKFLRACGGFTID